MSLAVSVKSLRWTILLPAFLSVLYSFQALAESELGGHAWEFEVQKPGAYELQVIHRGGTNMPLPPNLRAQYIIETKEEPFGRLMAPIQNQPFTPVTATVASPQRIRVIIAGLPRRMLDQTKVSVYEASSPQPSVASVDPGPFKEQFSAPPEQPASTEPTFSKAVEKLLALPEDKIDIGTAAFTLAKEVYPDVDIAAYSQRLDDLAQKVRQLANDPKDPETRVRALNTVLHLNEDFRYDHSPGARENLDNLFLHRYLDRRRGTCVTMPLLYVAVGQRLGYPIRPVVAPDHMFARYVDPNFAWQNIETTSGGKYFTNEDYIRRFFVSDKGLATGSYMRAMTRRELLGHLLSANAAVFGRRGEAAKAIKYLEKAIQFDPKFADHYDNLATAYRAVGQATKNSELAAQYREKAKRYASKAKQLGFVNPTAQMGVGLRGT